MGSTTVISLPSSGDGRTAVHEHLPACLHNNASRLWVAVGPPRVANTHEQATRRSAAWCAAS